MPWCSRPDEARKLSVELARAAALLLLPSAPARTIGAVSLSIRKETSHETTGFGLGGRGADADGRRRGALGRFALDSQGDVLDPKSVFFTWRDGKHAEM